MNSTVELEDEYGNRADNESNLYFVDYNDTAEYITSLEVPTYSVMQSFFSTAKAIASFCVGTGYPYDFVMSLSRGQVSFSSAFHFLKGCVGLSLLLLTIFTVLAFTLPCCLCCSPCCRRTANKEPPSRRRTAAKQPPSQRRVIATATLVFVLVAVFGVVGIVATVYSIDYTTETLDMILKTFVEALRDIKTYILFSADEILFIFVKAKLIQRVFFRFLDNPPMGEIIRNTLWDKTGLGDAVAELRQLECKSAVLVDRLDENVDKLLSAVRSINDDVNAILLKACRRLVCPPYSPVHISKPNLLPAKRRVQPLLATNMSAVIDERVTEVESIPQKTAEASTQQISALKSNLRTQLNALTRFEDVVGDVKDSIIFGLDIEGKEKVLRSLHRQTMKVDTTRSKLMKGAVMLDVLAMVMVLTGTVMLALIYRQNYNSFMETGSESGCKNRTVVWGKVIYAGAGIFVMLGWLWMVCAFILLLIGAPMERIFCAVVNDPEYQIIDTLIEEKNIFGEYHGSWLTKRILSIPNATVTVGRLLRDCRNNTSLYKSVEMDKHPIANFSRLIEFKDKLDIDRQIGSIDVPVGDVDVLSGPVGSYLQQMNEVGPAVPFDELNAVLDKTDAADSRMKMYIARLPVAARPVLRARVGPQLREVGRLKVLIRDDSQQLERNLLNMSGIIDNTRNKTIAAQSNVASMHKRAISQVAKEMKDKIFKIVDSFINEAKKNVFEDYGKCRPLYNIFHAVLHDRICGNIVNVINGSWLALVWLHVSMLLAIMAAIWLNTTIPGSPTLHHSALPTPSAQAVQKPDETESSSDVRTKSDEERNLQKAASERVCLASWDQHKKARPMISAQRVASTYL